VPPATASTSSPPAAGPSSTCCPPGDDLHTVDRDNLAMALGFIHREYTEAVEALLAQLLPG